MKRLLYFACTSAFLLAATDTPQPYDHPREKIEWTNIMHYNGDDTAAPRVLLVGDSICNQYNDFVREELTGTANVSFYATSKCCTDRTYLDALRLILNEYDYTVIHFNNGLHSLDTPPDEWERALRAAFKLMREVEPAAKLIWCNSTPVKDPAKTEKAQALNAIGEKVAKEFNAPTNDLFALMTPLDRAEHWSDDYHFKEPARRMQAKQVAASVKAQLAEQRN